MKVNYLLGSILALSMTFFSCGEGSKKEESEKSQTEKNVIAAEDISKPVTAKFQNDTIQKVYENYLLIKDGLVLEETGKVKEAANRIVEAYGENASENEVALRAKRVGGSDNIYEQRDHFSGLTKSLEEVLKNNIKEGSIHKQYCPMAFGGKGGYWYSNEEQIRNPYYGDKMLKCGRIEETFQ